LSKTPSAARIAEASSCVTPRRSRARAQSSVSAIEGGFLSASLRSALTKRAASAASCASSSGILSSMMRRSCSRPGKSMNRCRQRRRSAFFRLRLARESQSRARAAEQHVELVLVGLGDRDQIGDPPMTRHYHRQ
jgi:hypothetical protein